MVFPRVGSEVFCSYSRISLYFDLNGIFLKLYLFALSVHNIHIRSHVNSANTKRLSKSRPEINAKSILL